MREPSIRPVRVDETGRIFEMTGEQIVVPGLEPQKILASFEDERAGRVRSMKDIQRDRAAELAARGDAPGQ